MNISQITIDKLKLLGYDILFYDNGMNTVPKEHAISFTIYCLDPYEMFSSIKPLKKEMSYEWIIQQIDKKKTFQSIKWCEVFKPLELFNVGYYTTSYGVGVEVIFGRREETIQKIDTFLKSHQIEFTNEYSGAGWVYRFKISKAKDNIEKLNKLFEQ
jgi:hypothetical protein